MSDIESYKYVVEIYKGYLDTAITANVWFYTLTGAIVANYVAHYREEGKKFLRYSLFVPFFFGLLLTVTSAVGIGKSLQLERTVVEIAGKVGVIGTPPIDILVMFLYASAFLSGLVCLCLLSLFSWWPSWLYREAKDGAAAPATDEVPAALTPAGGKTLPPGSPQDDLPRAASAAKKNGAEIR